MVEVLLNRLETARKGPLLQVVLRHHVASVQSALGFVKAAMASLLCGEDCAGGIAGNIRARRWIARVVVLVFVGRSILVPAGYTQKKVFRRAVVHIAKDRSFKTVLYIAV